MIRVNCVIFLDKKLDSTLSPHVGEHNAEDNPTVYSSVREGE